MQGVALTVDLRYLLDFLDLARTGNFSASARNRSISQPALTRRIQQLEAWSGKLLFDRSATPLRLTAAGEDFRPVAARIVGELEAFRKRTARDGVRTALRCMSIHSLGTVFLPNWLSRGVRRPPRSMPAISFGTYDQCFAALRENEIDLALVYHTARVREPRFKGLSRTCVGTETFIPVVSADYAGRIHGWQKAGAAAPVLVELSRDNYLGKALSAAFDHSRRRLGYVPGPVAVRIDAVRGLVDAGCGIGWLPESMVRADLDAGSLVAFKHRTPKVKLDVVLIAAAEEKLAMVGEPREPAGAAPSAPDRPKTVMHSH
jgi:DNA-binding transcriptional LysR family regulator